MAAAQTTQLKAAASEKVPTRAALSEMRPIPRRGLSRIEAAMYIGISPTKFDELVGDGRMPKSIALDGRKLWDVRRLDVAFDALDPDPPDLSWSNFEETAPPGRI
jgi:hypothetical protein